MRQTARTTEMIESLLNERDNDVLVAAEFVACALACNEEYRMSVEEEVKVNAIVAIYC